MDAYYGSLKIYEVLGYAEVPESVKTLMGDQMCMVRFGNENGKPIVIRTDEIEIK